MKNKWLIAVSVLFQLIGFISMALDPKPQGFGWLTLWLAPIVLTIGFFTPLICFSGPLTFSAFTFRRNFRSYGAYGVFIVSLSNYLITLEPTASLWDCSEFIATAYKLQIPHTPGTPLTLLFGRLFSMLSFGDVYKVAFMVNAMSALTSAFTVALVYLTVWHFGRKWTSNDRVLLISCTFGSLCLAFSDTFWFSAVEAETYGPSVFFMMLIMYLSITTRREEPNERLLLLSYLTGLSYCIHPMCILIFPVIPIVWMSSERLTLRSLLSAMVIGIGVILFISRIIAVGFFEWSFKIDLLLVNHLGFPFYSGVFVLAGMVILFYYLIWKKWKKIRLYLLASMLMIAGFTPYFILFIRSTHNPPINEFSPGDLAMIKPYMNRESYPGRPLLYGPFFDASITDYETKAKSYIQGDEAYLHRGNILKYQYEASRNTILPRIYSNDENHMETYRNWTGLAEGEKPKFSNNLEFLFKYQLGHMYVRYFLWNFVGRDGDRQHSGWLTPWEKTDNRQDILYNRAQNQLFGLPLLLGLIGLLAHRKKNQKDFITNLTFFLITGLLLALYLNATPNEPRERDYIYVGSYVAFSIWIGLGWLYIFQISRNRFLRYYLIPIAGISFLGWIYYQNFDDHDRSERTFQIDHSKNMLASCEKNAILFTGGDNDTFPLWYLQEVEGFRTDVRVKVLSYFNADWYINQLRRKYYDSPPYKLSLTDEVGSYGPYEAIYVKELMDVPIRSENYLQAIRSDNSQLKIATKSEEEYFILPSRTVIVSMPQGKMELTVTGNYLQKNALAILDLITNNDLDRPVYFNFTSLNSLGIDFRPYLKQEGLIYRLKADRNESGDIEMDLRKTYENLIGKGDYQNLSNSKIYFNYEDYQARMITPLKKNFNLLIEKYLELGNLMMAEKVIDFTLEKLYFDHHDPMFTDLELGTYLKMVNREEEANKLIERVFTYYYTSLKQTVEQDEVPERMGIYLVRESARVLNDPEIFLKVRELFDQLNSDSK